MEGGQILRWTNISISFNISSGLSSGQFLSELVKKPVYNRVNASCESKFQTFSSAVSVKWPEVINERNIDDFLIFDQNFPQKA